MKVSDDVDYLCVKMCDDVDDYLCVKVYDDDDNYLYVKVCDDDDNYLCVKVCDVDDYLCVKVLDKMLLYLRIVYSFDYYSTVEYPHEDAMPHRCGIFHARGPLPRGKVVQRDRKLSADSYEISCFVAVTE